MSTKDTLDEAALIASTLGVTIAAQSPDTRYLRIEFPDEVTAEQYMDAVAYLDADVTPDGETAVIIQRR